MRRWILLDFIFPMMIISGAGCFSNNDNYCCKNNDQCLETEAEGLHSCSLDTCKCEVVDPMTVALDGDWNNATVGQKDYNVKLKAKGGLAPYTWKFSIEGDKLSWITLKVDENDSSIAWLINNTVNNQLLVPDNPSIENEVLTIEVTVMDNSKHGTDPGRVDDMGKTWEHNMIIYECKTGSDCVSSSVDPSCSDAVCNAGKCQYTIAQGRVCLVAGCSNGFVYNQRTCNADGICEIPADNGTSCNGFACADAMNCKMTCTSQADCVGASHCLSTNKCEELRIDGEACTSPEQCQSTFCANDVCCKTACTGVCQDCNASGVCDKMPNDDSNCTIDCSGFNTECKKYSNPTTNRCASFGTCKSADANSCTAFTFVMPTVSIWADPQTIPADLTTRIYWSSSCASSCTAIGGWTSNTGTEGNQTTSALAAETVFVLECTGDGGTNYGSTTVSIKPWTNIVDIGTCGSTDDSCNEFLSNINQAGYAASAPRVKYHDINPGTKYYNNACYYLLTCSDGKTANGICPPDLTISNTSVCTFSCPSGTTISSFKPCGGAYLDSWLEKYNYNTQTRR